MLAAPARILKRRGTVACGENLAPEYQNADNATEIVHRAQPAAARILVRRGTVACDTELAPAHQSAENAPSQSAHHGNLVEVRTASETDNINSTQVMQEKNSDYHLHWSESDDSTNDQMSVVDRLPLGDDLSREQRSAPEILQRDQPTAACILVRRGTVACGDKMMVRTANEAFPERSVDLQLNLSGSDYSRTLRSSRSDQQPLLRHVPSLIPIQQGNYLNRNWIPRSEIIPDNFAAA